MKYIRRMIETELSRAAKSFPAVIVPGPRRAGKTTLLQELFPKSSYPLLEDPDLISRVRSDPRSFLEEIRRPAILDEIQNAPELLNYIRGNRLPRNIGNTGSHLRLRKLKSQKHKKPTSG